MAFRAPWSAAPAGDDDYESRWEGRDEVAGIGSRETMMNTPPLQRTGRAWEFDKKTIARILRDPGGGEDGVTHRRRAAWKQTDGSQRARQLGRGLRAT